MLSAQVATVWPAGRLAGHLLLTPLPPVGLNLATILIIARSAAIFSPEHSAAVAAAAAIFVASRSALILPKCANSNSSSNGNNNNNNNNSNHHDAGRRWLGRVIGNQANWGHPSPRQRSLAGGGRLGELSASRRTVAQLVRRAICLNNRQATSGCPLPPRGRLEAAPTGTTEP